MTDETFEFASAYEACPMCGIVIPESDDLEEAGTWDGSLGPGFGIMYMIPCPSCGHSLIGLQYFADGASRILWECRRNPR
jgi:predicted RNA-binding Zn-ribbon protein involved in translation (DUF1610 family)